MLSRGQPCSNRPETRSREKLFDYRILQFEDTWFFFFLTNFSQRSIKRVIIIITFNFYLFIFDLFVAVFIFNYNSFTDIFHSVIMKRKTHGMTVSTSVTDGYKSLGTLSIRSFLFIYIYILSYTLRWLHNNKTRTLKVKVSWSFICGFSCHFRRVI